MALGNIKQTQYQISQAAVVGSSSPSIVTYQIIDGNTNGAFVIDAVSGLLSVKRPITYRETPQQIGQWVLQVEMLFYFLLLVLNEKDVLWLNINMCRSRRS